MKKSCKLNSWGMVLTIAGLISFFGCSKEDPMPVNPYSLLSFKDKKTSNYNPDSSTITGLHYYIFQRKCATPGCHDGHFEPDFRTVQSSYSTMVWQGVVKNTPDKRFKYRVWPGKADSSWLVERCVTGDAVLGRMPLYSEPLNSSELKAIRSWINKGAEDPFGEKRANPTLNPEPSFYDVVITSTTPDSTRYDTPRIDDNWAHPIRLPANKSVVMYVGFWDSETPITNFTGNRLLISDKMNDFTNARVLKATLSLIPKSVPNPWSQGHTLHYFWYVTFNTSDFEKNKNYYFRYELNDGHQPKDIQVPNNGSNVWFKNHCAFFVE